MWVVKGFVNIRSMIDNAPGEIATLGELSTYGKTFSRDLGFYNNPEYSSVELITHRSTDSDVPTELPTDLRNDLLALLDAIQTEAEAGTFTDAAVSFTDYMQNTWGDDFTDLEIGDMVAGDNDQYLPQYMRLVWKQSTYGDNLIRLWFSDNAFRAQYDEHEIVVVAPVEDIDDLIDVPNAVETALNAESLSGWYQRIETAKDKNPPTMVRIETYSWIYPDVENNSQVDPNDSNVEQDTHWAVIIYGAAGNNIDAINLALEEHVLGNSTNDRTVWDDYIPDLFRATEFVIVPFWDEYSIENQTLQAGLYSPMVPYHKIMPLAEDVASRYNEGTHLQDTIYTGVVTYRNLSFMAVPSVENREAISTLKKTHEDYIMVPTTSTEFDRMSRETREWLSMFLQLLQTAEVMDDIYTMPVGQTRLYRGDNEYMYAVSSFDGIRYLVLSKQSYTTITENLFGSGS